MPFKKGDPRNKGRPKGATERNRRLTDDQRKALALAAGGITPLEFACSVLRDPKSSMTDKKWAVNTLMPYMHKKLPIAIEGGDPSKPISFLDMAQLKELSTKELEQFLTLIQKAGGVVTAEDGSIIEHDREGEDA